MLQNELIIQELGASKILVYKGDVDNLNFNLNLPNILTFVRTTFVDVPLCYFDVSGKSTLSETQRYTLDKFNILKMLKMTIAVAETCEAENIDFDSILLNNDYVFVDEEFNTYFIPLKIENENNVDIHTFLKNLVINSIIDPKYTDNFVQLLLNCFNEPNFSIEKLSSLVNQLLATKPYTLSYNIDGSDSDDNDESDGNYTDTIIVDMLKKQLDNSTNKPSLQQEEPENVPEDAPEQEYDNDDYLMEDEEQDDEDIEEYSTPKIPVNSGFVPNIGASSYLNKQQPSKKTQPIGKIRPLSDLPNIEQDEYDQQDDDDNYFIKHSHMENEPIYEDDLSTEMYQDDDYEEYDQHNTDLEEGENAFLIDSEDPNTRISINFNPFRVGRNPDLVDYVINSPYVGRLHAVIISDDDNKFFIVDKSSTNGTFLNGQRLQPEESVSLISGSVVRFAKHSFQFILE